MMKYAANNITRQQEAARRARRILQHCYDVNTLGVTEALTALLRDLYTLAEVSNVGADTAHKRAMLLLQTGEVQS